MKIRVDDIRALRESTGAPVMRAKQVLEEVGGDYKRAEEILRKEGFEKSAKRSGRETANGLIETYVHHSGKIAAVVELLCETDFVARGEIFHDLAHNLALQLASSPASDADELLAQEFIKTPGMKVDDLVKEAIVKTGENIVVGRIYRVEIGK